MIVRGSLTIEATPGETRVIRNTNPSDGTLRIFDTLTSDTPLPNNTLVFGQNEFVKTIYCNGRVDVENPAALWQTSHGHRVALKPWFDISDWEFGGRNNIDNWDALQKACNAANKAEPFWDGQLGELTFGGGGVIIPAWDSVIVGKPVRVGVRTEVTGSGAGHVTRIKRSRANGSGYGPIWECFPTDLVLKSQNPPKSRLAKMFFDGADVGWTQFTGIGTFDSDIITNISAQLVTLMVNGTIIDFWGFPRDAYVIDRPTATSIRMNVKSARNSFGILNKGVGFAREAIRAVISSAVAAGQTFLPLLNAASLGFKAWQRIDGAPLGAIDDPGDDGDDGAIDGDNVVAQNSIIKAVDDTGIYLDRPLSTAAAANFPIHARREDDYILIQDYKLYEGQDLPGTRKAVGPSLHDLIGQYNNGPLVRGRPKRNSIRVNGCKFTNSNIGVDIGSCSDSEVTNSALGVNRWYQLRQGMSATVNWTNNEIYQTARTDIFGDAEVYACPTSYIAGTQGFNGTLRYIGKPGQPGVHKLMGMAFRHHDVSCYEDGTLPSFVRLEGGVHVYIGGGSTFEPDNGTKEGKINSVPDHIVWIGNTDNAARAFLETQAYLLPYSFTPVDGVSSKFGSYRVSLCNKPSQLSYRIVNRLTNSIETGGLQKFTGITDLAGGVAETSQQITMTFPSGQPGTDTIARTAGSVEFWRGTPSTGFICKMPPEPTPNQIIPLHWLQAATNFDLQVNPNASVAQRFATAPPTTYAKNTTMFVKWYAAHADGGGPAWDIVGFLSAPV